MSQSQLLVRLLKVRPDSAIVRYLGVSSVCSLKSNLPIKWLRPEKIPCIHPEKSGDLQPFMKINLKDLRPMEFQDSEELKTADETTKRLFTLEFFPQKKVKELAIDSYMSLVKRHDLDRRSPEARISRMTAIIRYLQVLMQQCSQNKRIKVRLKETIDKRKRLMLHLREQDYKCYEYLLEKLDLEYKPDPPKTVYMRVERKRSLRMLTTTYCNNIVQSKLDDYKSQLESRKEAFLQKKVDALKWMMKEEKECGASPTVSESDLVSTEEQLRDLQVKLAEEKLKKKQAEADL